MIIISKISFIFKILTKIRNKKKAKVSHILVFFYQPTGCTNFVNCNENRKKTIRLYDLCNEVYVCVFF